MSLDAIGNSLISKFDSSTKDTKDAQRTQRDTIVSRGGRETSHDAERPLRRGESLRSLREILRVLCVTFVSFVLLSQNQLTLASKNYWLCD
jgi:hypothetical protein